MEDTREIVLATASGKSPVRVRLPAAWKVRQTPISRLLARKHLAAITIVELDRTIGRVHLRSLAAALAKKRYTAAGGRFIVWSIAKTAGRQSHVHLDLIRPFAEPERAWIAYGRSDVEAVLRSLTAKVKVLAEGTKARSSAPKEEPTPRPSQLDQVRAIVAATKDLRAPSGNLSAPEISKLFGVSLSRLAKWLNRSRQALSKAPDADSLQTELGHFERIARLRAVLEDPDDFRKWLRMANQQIEGRPPLELLDKGRWQVLADLVDDMLTGNPT